MEKKRKTHFEKSNFSVARIEPLIRSDGVKSFGFDYESGNTRQLFEGLWCLLVAQLFGWMENSSFSNKAADDFQYSFRIASGLQLKGMHANSGILGFSLEEFLNWLCQTLVLGQLWLTQALAFGPSLVHNKVPLVVLLDFVIQEAHGWSSGFGFIGKVPVGIVEQVLFQVFL